MDTPPEAVILRIGLFPTTRNLFGGYVLSPQANRADERLWFTSGCCIMALLNPQNAHSAAARSTDLWLSAFVRPAVCGGCARTRFYRRPHHREPIAVPDAL